MLAITAVLDVAWRDDGRTAGAEVFVDRAERAAERDALRQRLIDLAVRLRRSGGGTTTRRGSSGEAEPPDPAGATAWKGRPADRKRGRRDERRD